MKAKAIEGKRSRASRSAKAAAAPAVEVTVTFRHLEPSAAIREYGERKFAHIGARLKRACSIHLILSVDKYRHLGEVTVKSGRLDLSAREETKDLYAVIDLLTDKVGRQLKDHLAKLESRRVRTTSTGELLAAAEDSTSNGQSMALSALSRFSER
jgi:putative sigma-54 modulation protein